MLTNHLSQTTTAELLVRSIVTTLGIFSGITIPASAQITYEGGKAVTPSNGTFTIQSDEGKQTNGNLFHSFGTFGVPTNQTANFEANSSVQNILGRVTGGAPSAIDGKLQVIGGDPKGVNLYLMNPAGIVFGKGASLDINGAFTATTAKAIDFNGKWFNALGTYNYNELTGNPIGLAFTGNTPGSIFNAATLSNVQPGKSITLVGGTVISTGDIKTAGGNISIATVEGGKYVQIKSQNNILSLNLPIGLPDNAKNIAADATAFKPPLLPVLLTGNTTKTLATGVTVENNVVKLVGDTRSILPGDIVTKNLNTAGEIIGGDVFLSTQTGNIITSDINAASTGQSDNKDSTDRYRDRYLYHGGSVNLKTQFGDIFVNSIDTSGNNTAGGGSKGGDVVINAGGLFRAIGLIGLSDISIATKGNGIFNNNSPLDVRENLGGIDITHQGSSFVVGAQVTFTPPVDRSVSKDGGTTEIVLTKDFKFPEDASGTRGAIFTRNTNGTYQVVFSNGAFKSSEGQTYGFGITATARQPKPPNTDDSGGQTGNQTGNQTTNPDQQASKPKSKDNCTPSSTSIAANPTTAPTRSAGNAIAISADPCQTNTSSSEILQILKDRE
jgi:filamentous hemagglutinin family protein